MNGASDDSSNLSGMVRSIRKAKNYGGNNKSEGYTNMVDLGELFNPPAATARLRQLWTL